MYIYQIPVDIASSRWAGRLDWSNKISEEGGVVWLASWVQEDFIEKETCKRITRFGEARRVFQGEKGRGMANKWQG